MANSMPEQDRFMKLLDSLRSVLRAEMALIDLDAKLTAKQDNQSLKDRRKSARDEKEALFRLLTPDMESALRKVAQARRAGWKRVKIARAEQLEKHAKKIRAAYKEEEKKEIAGIGSEALSDDPPPEGSIPLQCPPGFIEINGRCEQI